MWQPRYKWRTTTDFIVACHDPGLLSSSAGTGLWPIRWLFSASARAALQAAVHCFGSVAVAAEAIAIAVCAVGNKRAASSAGKPIGGINSPPGGDWIIETVSARIGGGRSA